MLLTLSGPAAALHGTVPPSVVVCGLIENPVGWELPGIEVRAVGRGLTSADHFPALVRTDGLGAFRVTILQDFYRLLITDPGPPSAHAGASYLGTSLEVAGHLATAGPCGAARGIDVGIVRLQAPHLGFIEASVRDAAVPQAAAGSLVSTAVMGAYPWGDDLANAMGVAEVSCPLGLPVTLRARAANFDENASALFTCAAGLTAMSINMWRAGVELRASVTDLVTGGPVPGAAASAEPAVLAPAAGHPYVFSATSDAAGLFRFLVPWSDSYDVTVAAVGFGANGTTVAVSADDIAAGIDLAFGLDRSVFPFSGKVIGATGAGVAANLSIVGPRPTLLLQNLTTDVDGDFATSLAQGEYQLFLASAGKNDRACTLFVGTAGATVLNPVGCLLLVSEGMGLVRGHVADLRTGLPVGGASVVADGGVPFSTLADGSYLLEGPSGASNVTASAAFFVTASAPVEIPLDGNGEAPDINLTRALVDVTFATRDASTLAAVAGAEICPTLVLAAGGDEDVDCIIGGPTGATFQLEWTRRSGAFDIGSYRVEAERLTAAPLYDIQACLAALEVDTTIAGTTVACPLVAAAGIATLVGPLRDAHTDLPIAGLAVSTGLPGNVPCAPYVCAGTTGALGTALLSLPEDRTFDIHVDTGRYQDVPDILDSPPGTSVFVGTELLRDTQNATVEIKDAHTLSPLSGKSVAGLSLGFTCDPAAGAGGIACGGATGADGVAELVLPWGDYNRSVPDGDASVELDGESEAGVGFRGLDDAAFTVDDEDVDLGTFHLRRMTGPAVAGTALDFSGAPASGTLLDVHSEREGLGFVCDPPADSPLGGFPDCAGTAAEGAFSLDLPVGNTTDHLWTLTASAPGHFSETLTGVAQPADLDITLWPLLFDLVVEPRDATSGELAPLVVVCIVNLDQAAASLPAFPNERCASSGVDATPLLFDNVTWIRDPADPADTTDRFLVRAVGTLHLPNAAIFELGPDATSVELSLVPLDPTLPTFTAGIIQGTVTDADAAPPAPMGAALVTVTATAPCAPAPVMAATAPDGSYALPVPCADEYAVAFVDPLGRYVPATPNVTVPSVPLPGLGQAFLNVALDRVRGAATVTVLDATTGLGVAGAAVDALGIGVAATGSAETGPDGVADLGDLPWGVYSVHVTAPAGAWTLGEADTALAVRPGEGGTTVALLAGPPPEPEADACDGGPTPDVCPPVPIDNVRMVRVSATSPTVGAVTGEWLLIPPRLGASPAAAVGTSVAPPGTYPGPHDGTWTVVFVPPAAAAALTTPITLRMEYTVDGLPRETSAVLVAPVVPGPPLNIYPTMVWTVNLHAGAEDVACAPAVVFDCGLPAGVDAVALGRMRFFSP